MNQPTDQKVEMVWETPSADEIVNLSKSHVEAMENIAGDHEHADAVWSQAGMAHILLHTVGRKSGNTHKIALPTWRDPDGHRIVVASFAGAKGHPSWYHNLADRTANPRVLVKAQSGAFWSDQEILEGDEHPRIWGLLTTDRAWYDNYQAKTDRRIPLVRLPETEAVEK